MPYKKDLKKEELLNYLQQLISKGLFHLIDRDWDNDPLTQEEIDKTKDGVIGWKTTNVTYLPLYTNPLNFINGIITLVDREHVWSNNDSNKKEHLNLFMGDRKNNQNGHNNLPFSNVVDKEKAKKYNNLQQEKLPET